MPELPEVETVVRDLRPLLTRRVLRAVRRASAADLRRAWDSSWEPLLAGRRVSALDRRGKWIIVRLDDGSALLVHLGMTGQFTVSPRDEALPTHTHLVFDLDSPTHLLRFRDTRRFGCVVRVPDDAAVVKHFADNGMGPEPFGLDADAWAASLAGTNRVVKAVLLDQTVVAGVGNIYADEALHRSGIHPTVRAADLPRPAADRLRLAVEEVLTTAVESRGSTIRDYIGGSGLRGGYQDEFRAYGRTGEPCPTCATPIRVLRVAGRSSHFCPACQPEPKPSPSPPTE